MDTNVWNQPCPPVSVDPDDLLTVTTTHLRSSSPVINLVNPGVLYMVCDAFADIIERTEARAVNPDDKDNLVAKDNRARARINKCARA